MNTKMYVGNLSYGASEEEVRELFEQYGEVTDVFIVKDRETQRPRGFAFVSMGDEAARDLAIENLHDQEFLGRNLTVNEARPREENGGGRGKGGGGGYQGKRGGGDRPSYGDRDRRGGGGRGGQRRGGGGDRDRRGGGRRGQNSWGDDGGNW